MTGFPGWPTVLPVGSTPTESVQGSPSEPRRVAVSNVAENNAMPILYGSFRIQARPFILGVDGSGNITVAWLVGLGPIQAIDGYTLSGNAAPITGVTFETRLGAPNTTVSSRLGSLIAGYAQVHPWWAMLFATITYESVVYGGLPVATVWGRGRNDIYDPRTAGRAYTANTALCCAHFAEIAEGCGYGTAGIDWDAVEVCADHCDFNPSTSDTRYRIAAALDTIRPAREHLNELMRHARLAESYDQGKWKLLCESQGSAPVATIDTDWLLTAGRGALEARAYQLGPDDQRTVVSISHSEPARGYEMYPQEQWAPGIAEGTVRRITDSLSAPWLQSASVAARLAESTMFEKLCDQRLSLVCNRRALPLEPCDLVWVKGPLGIEHNAIEFNGTSSGAISTVVADLDLDAAGSIDIDFTCLGDTGAAQVLVDRWHNVAGHNYGYAALISSTTGRLSLRFGGGTVDGCGPGDLRDGRLHRLRISWTQAGRLIAWLDGVEVANVSGAAASALEDDVATTVGYRNESGTGSLYFLGRISRLRFWSAARTRWEHWRDRRRTLTAPYPADLVADFECVVQGTDTLFDLNNGYELTCVDVTNTTEGELYRVESVRPTAQRARVNVELREASPVSTATATVTSTGSSSVDRVTTKTTPSLPDPTAAPPAPTGLSLAVYEDTVAGATRYKIRADWNPATSGFVRGYRVRVVAGSADRTILDGSRVANQALIDVLEPNVLHTVYVYALGTNGLSSTALSGTVTPGSISVSVSGSGSFGTKMVAPLQERKNTSATHYSGWWVTLSWTPSGSTSDIREFRIFRNGKQVATADPDKTSIQLLSHHEVKDNSQGNSADQVICACSTSDTFRVDAVLKDGRTVTSGSISVSGSGSDINEYQTFSNYGEDVVCMHDSFAGTMMPAVGSAPSKADKLWRNTSDWVWRKDQTGRGYPDTASGANYYTDITFPTAFPAGVTPRITLGPREAYLYWHTNESNTGFRLWSTNGSEGCDWRATAPLE